MESARYLQQGVLTSVHDSNIRSIFGIGFPAWTGGALPFISGQGVDAFANAFAELAALYGGGVFIDTRSHFQPQTAPAGVLRELGRGRPSEIKQPREAAFFAFDVFD
ncbi:hypothetical protein B9Z51_10140 [Limnohabitans sp. T6-5]|uniref:hypothetical protein n=1 Tax=Limnohabitans sp. T6-5 TaxID=1100724 RepID=UPI000DD1988B|nr:hypothetical protein B9Z51_10140 [Limnohabitans sp. T6-5]